MSHGKSSLLRKLIPKSYHFDGYNEVKCPNSRAEPFFVEGMANIGDYFLNKRFDNSGNLILEYSSVCPNGLISFKPYTLSFERFIELLRTAIDEESDFITFQIQVNYKPCSGQECTDKNKHCSYLLNSKPHTIMAAVSFEVTDIKNALSVYFGINKPKSFIKGGNKMIGNKKNIFGMEFELGLSKDRNISSTLMGLAVRNEANGNWYVFDTVNKTRKNIANIKMGDFPVLLLPTKMLQVGDLTKIDGKYYYVQSVDENIIKLIGADDGFIKEMLTSESIIPGMTLYTKVVAFDVKTLSDPNSKDNMAGNIMAAMCMMQWSKGKSEFSLDDINEDSFNGLGSIWPMLMASGAINGSGGLFGNDNSLSLPLLMMMGGDNSENNGGMQFLALNYLLGGGNGNNSMFGGAIPGITTTAVASGVTHAGEVYCPECKATYPAGTNFCSKCGTETVSTASNVGQVYCPECNVTYPAGTNFCPKCGAATLSKGKVCAKCGTTLNDGAAFCHNCGQKVVNDFCPECGEKVTEGAKFCSKCGTSLTPAPKKAATPKPTPKKNTNNARKKADPKPEVPKDSDM